MEDHDDPQNLTANELLSSSVMRPSYLSLATASLVALFAVTVPPTRASTVAVSDDLVIHYLAAGHGPTPIVSVPGWTMSSAVFIRQLKHFAPSSTYRFISYDPRSQGLSTHLNVGNTYQQRGHDLHAFLNKLGLHGVILAGWSNGAYDVLSYLHQFGPSDLKALILIDGTPACSGKDNRTDWVWFRYDDADHYRQSVTDGILFHRQAFERGFADWMVEDPTPQYRRWVMHIMDQTPPETAALLNETSAYLDYTADLQALNGRLPLLYVVEHAKGNAALRWSKAHTPSATVVVFGRHLMFWERAGQFNQVIDQFLKQVR